MNCSRCVSVRNTAKARPGSPCLEGSLVVPSQKRGATESELNPLCPAITVGSHSKITRPKSRIPIVGRVILGSLSWRISWHKGFELHFAAPPFFEEREEQAPLEEGHAGPFASAELRGGRGGVG